MNRPQAARLLPLLGQMAIAVAILALLTGTKAQAQSFRTLGVQFEAARTVKIPAKEMRPVAEVEFLHQGLIGPEGRNVVVLGRDHKPVPVRVLQLGPGDFCRLAFETAERQTDYTILYGGPGPEAGRAPKWSSDVGLLLETRHFKQCNLRRLDSVRQAFESAAPLGAGYVDRVYHARNPFQLTPGPFLSRYSGTLHVDKPGEYLFWTSSENCSFLLVDGQVIVEALGHRRPLYQARPSLAGKKNLTAGPHRFEYYHAAAGDYAMMTAFWIQATGEPKPRPVVIPAEAFQSDQVARVTPGPVSLRTATTVPDFTYTLAGCVPLPDESRPLVGVLFTTRAVGVLSRANVQWD
ncbi:MAG: hypothetical protein JW818_18290, partial [Pirellulales bacterium]|nr:hypothetical protein [Pirellulales bacterium]